MDKEVLDALHGRAKKIALHIARHLPTEGQHNDWKGYDGRDLEWKIWEPGVISFKYNEYAIMTFGGLSPADISKQILHEPRVLRSDTVDAHSSVIVNESSVEQTRVYSIDMTETKTMEHDVGVSLTTGIKAKMGTPEAAPVQAEVEVSVEATASYNKRFGESSETSRQTDTEITIPPGKRVTVTTSRSKSFLEQRCEYWCDVDHSIRIWSHNDWDFTWNSMSEMLEATSGYAPETIHFAWYYKDKPLDKRYRDQIGESLSIYYDDTVRFENATTGHVTITEEDL